MEEILRPYGSGKPFDGPVYGGGNSFNAAVEDFISTCAAGGSGTQCADLTRVTNAASKRLSVKYESRMNVHRQSCRIFDEDRNVTVDISNAPAEPLEKALWLSSYEAAKTLAGYCRIENQGKVYPEAGPEESPFYRREGADLQYHAHVRGRAHAAATKPLLDYLKANCRDSDVTMDSPILLGRCNKDDPTGAIKIEGKTLNEPRRYLVRMDPSEDSIWTDESSFELDPDVNAKKDQSVGGRCNCCQEKTVQNKAYLFGGPEQSILVGETTVTLFCASDPDCPESRGDPHLCTHDGVLYDFQGVGEYILSKADGFEVQARFRPYRTSRFASENAAVAAKIGTDRVSIISGSPAKLFVNGKPFELEAGDSIRLPGGATLRSDGTIYRFVGKGFVVEAKNSATRLNWIRLQVPEGTLSSGLLGSRNGKRADDLTLPDGTALSRPIAFHELYGKFGNAWRISAANSLFDYAKGETTATFTDTSLPLRKTSIKDIGTESRRAAEAICRKAGVTGAANLADCAFDIAVTGDESFAEDAKGGREQVEPLQIADKKPSERTTADGVRIEVPSEGMASFPVEIRVTGPAAAHTLMFALVGSPATSRPPNAYSSVRLKGGEQVVTLHAPYRPGEYELRYVTFPGNRNILLGIPFRSVAPIVNILADETAPAGGILKVILEGDLSPNTKVTVVPIESREDLVGPHAYVKGGFRETVTIRRLPRTPGKYEIRFVSATSETVYARKEIEIR